MGESKDASKWAVKMTTKKTVHLNVRIVTRVLYCMKKPSDSRSPLCILVQFLSDHKTGQAFCQLMIRHTFLSLLKRCLVKIYLFVRTRLTTCFPTSCLTGILKDIAFHALQTGSEVIFVHSFVFHSFVVHLPVFKLFLSSFLGTHFSLSVLFDFLLEMHQSQIAVFFRIILKYESIFDMFFFCLKYVQIQSLF